MKRKDLLAICEKLIKSYNPEKTTVDSHADEELRNFETADRLFLQQVFYGTYRYRELLKPLLTHFLNTNSSRVSRNDYIKFMIIAYLAMFRVDEMGTTAFFSLVSVLDPTSMHVFLSYFYDETILKGPIRTEWIRVLDQDFVDTEIINKMLVHKAEVNVVLEQLYAKAFGRAAAKENLRATGGVTPVEKKALTIPQSPKITQPRSRQVVEPIRIPQEVKANPVPTTLNKITLADLEKQQQERKEKIKNEVTKKYDDAAKHMFHFESIARSNLDAVAAEVHAQRSAELQFEFKAKPAPEISSKPKEIKLNTAAILREDALFKKKQAKEAQLLQTYEAELRDPMEFYRWQTEMRQQDHEKWKQEVETRRLEMVQAQYEAIEAAHRAKMENRQVAIEMKAIAKDLQTQRLVEEQEVVEENREKMQEIRKVRDIAPRQAEERVMEQKQKQREELNVFLTQERERKATQDAIEQAQREDLIRQIRALDRVHREHVVVFDPTETAQLGLLEEMSLTELRERLQVRKNEQAAWEASRRAEIVIDKQEKIASLEDKVKTLSKLRRAAATANAMERNRKKAIKEKQQQEEEERRKEGNLKLAQKLMEQRRVRENQIQQLKQEADAISKKKMFLGAAKAMLEENHFDQLKQGAERAAMTRQTTTQHTAVMYEKIRSKEQETRIEHAQTLLIAKQREDERNTQIQQQARRESRIREQMTMEQLRGIVQNEKLRYKHAKDVLQTRNVYATMLSQPSNQHDKH